MLHEKWIRLIVPCLLGGILFLIIYGLTPLNVKNDSWIMAGYDETDIIQHYSGWIAFRNSEWAFPIGLAGDMACEDGTYISYTDSIPWVAIVFKLIRGILPDTFQYFGIYTLLCYILQGVAAFNIIFYKCRNMLYAATGTILFITAPILLERALRHTALGSQWLILFAILIYLMHRDKPKNIHYAEYLLLLILAIGIHPYFLPPIGIFLLLCVINDVVQKKFLSIVLMMADLVGTYCCGRIIGVLGTGIRPSRKDYGVYSMNLNALINPTSIGGYTWSAFVKTLPQRAGNGDGFNYLGLGIMAGIFLVAVMGILLKENCDFKAWIKRNGIAIFFLFCCTLFAVTNVVSFNDRVLLEVPLPEWLRYICGIFRASARIFYPVYYCIFIVIIYRIWRLRKRTTEKRICFILGLLVLIQLFDIHICIWEKHKSMQENAGYESLADDVVLNKIMSGNEYLVLDGYYEANRSLAVTALKNNLKIYYSTANSGDYSHTAMKNQEIIDSIHKTGKIAPCVVVTIDPVIVDKYVNYENIGCYQKDGLYFLYDSKNYSEGLT